MLKKIRGENMEYIEGLLRRAVRRLEERLKHKSNIENKYRKRVRNRNKLYQKKLKLNRRL
ncbi:hypothetical protein G8S55_11280 [Clostridium botulinum C]|uniref:hypothetical protein n=1 Tax=Clostridium botulinum TaxID=1491 RepID=UPI001E398AD8|nr:hypothetical protein [Clostridium botulinum]MCD3217800.1 hypothetical protein [Clostridium botulinum C]